MFGNQRWTIKDPEVCGGGGGVGIVLVDDDDDDRLVEMRGSSVTQ